MALYRTGLYVKNHSVEKVQVAKTPIASYNGNVTGLYIPELIAYITAKQSGSGTPSPDNIRPIIGASECNVVDMSDNTNINYFRGLLNGTYGFVDLGSLSWTYNTSYSVFIANLPNNAKSTTCVCTEYEYSGSSYGNARPDDTINCGLGFFGAGKVTVKDTDYTDATAFTTAVRGVYVIYELATPVTPTITEEQFNTLLTAFGISGWCVNIQLGDTYYGGSLDVTTGELTVDRQIVTLDGSESYSVASQAYIKSDACDAFVTNNDIYPIGFYGNQPNDLFCDKLNFVKKAIWNTVGYSNCFAINNTQIHINVANDLLGITDYTQETQSTVTQKIKNWITNNPITITIPVSPITVQLTPSQVEQLLVNNVWADTGDVEVKFFNVIR